MFKAMTPEVQAIMEERFGHDCLIALATLDEGAPAVRTVDGYYENGSFYVITHSKSGKMLQLERSSAAAVSGEWFTARGVGENIGHVKSEQNAKIAGRLRKAFAAWYGNGHVNEDDPGTCILRVRLQSGVLHHHGTRYDIDFSAPVSEG